MKKATIDYVSFCLGGLLFGLGALLLSVHLLQEDGFPRYIHELLHNLFILLVVVTFIYVGFKYFLARQYLKTELKPLTEIINETLDSKRNDWTLKELQHLKIFEIVPKAKEIVAWYSNYQAKTLLVRTAIQIVSAIVIFTSAVILLDQLREMRNQTTQFQRQLEVSTTQNQLLGEQIELQRVQNNDERRTETIKLLYGSKPKPKTAS